jgi:peptide/nickel transport system substrate-binding protein
MAPDLVESFEQTDPLTYRFRLRHGITFHTGKSLEAEDVVYTYNSILNGSIITTKKAVLEDIASVTAMSRDVVEIRLKQPFNRLLVNLNIGIVPRNAPPDFGAHPVGTGPYHLVEYQPDSFAKLEAFPQYFDGPPRTRHLLIRIIPDATTRALELRKGSIDLLILDIPPDYFEVLRKDAALRTITAPGNRYAYLGFNLRDPILGRKEVRQAIGYSINRKPIVDTIFHGSANLAAGLLPPGNWAYEDDVLHLSYDPQHAKRLLDAAGLADPDGDGPKTRFEVAFKNTTNELRRVIATVIAKDLTTVGIGVNVRSYEWGTFFADVNRGNFQMFLLQWVGESDPDIFRSVFETHGSRNRGKYSDPELDRWVAQAGLETTEEDQKKYYSLIQKKVAEDCPYISLWYEANVAVMRKELGGMRLTPDADYRALKDAHWTH